MSYAYHQGLARWVLVLPTAGATSHVAHTPSIPTIMGSTATPSLVGLSTPSLQPQPPAVPPMTPVIGEVPSGAPPNENVEMNEPMTTSTPPGSWIRVTHELSSSVVCISQHLGLII